MIFGAIADVCNQHYLQVVNIFERYFLFFICLVILLKDSTMIIEIIPVVFSPNEQSEYIYVCSLEHAHLLNKWKI